MRSAFPRHAMFLGVLHVLHVLHLGRVGVEVLLSLSLQREKKCVCGREHLVLRLYPRGCRLSSAP